MSDTEAQQPQPTVFLFGFRDQTHAAPPPDSPLVLWLSGRAVELTPELSKAIHGEFGAQERYRKRMRAAVERVMAELASTAASHASMLDRPYASLEEAQQSGYSAGQFEAYSQAAAALGELLLVASASVGE